MIITKQTEAQETKSENHLAQRFAVIIIGIIETVLAFRLAFELLGANAGNSFVHGLYAVSQPFVGLFAGIFSRVSINGGQTIAVFEPATLIAMAVVALIAWVILKLTAPRFEVRSEKTEYSENNDQENNSQSASVDDIKM